MGIELPLNGRISDFSAFPAAFSPFFISEDHLAGNKNYEPKRVNLPSLRLQQNSKEWNRENAFRQNSEVHMLHLRSWLHRVISPSKTTKTSKTSKTSKYLPSGGAIEWRQVSKMWRPKPLARWVPLSALRRHCSSALLLSRLQSQVLKAKRTTRFLNLSFFFFEEGSN